MTGEGRDEVHQRWSKAPGRQCVAPRTSTGHARTMRVRVDNWVGRSLMLSGDGDRRPKDSATQPLSSGELRRVDWSDACRHGAARPCHPTSATE